MSIHSCIMGGMGTIHSQNDFIIYRDSHAMTLNLLSAAVRARVTRFLYASSACVYPDSLQRDTLVDVELEEGNVWSNPPTEPQGLWGLEKLNSELLLYQFKEQIEISVARFQSSSRSTRSLLELPDATSNDLSQSCWSFMSGMPTTYSAIRASSLILTD